MSDTAARRIDAALAELRTRLRGRVLVPGEPEFAPANEVALGGITATPAAIARVTDAAYVSAVVAAARDTGLELAIRSGGHSGAAHGTTDGGLVLDVRGLRELEIDAAARTAWVGSGLTAGEVTAALAEHGLAIGFGDTGTVGVGGLTLGGGVGYLVRRFGLTIDSLLAAELVTADGTVHLVDADAEPDLFWAIRGGGGNLGVATRFQFRLHELAGVVGGILVLPATPETVAGFIAAAEAAPEELSTIANVMPAPPMPFLPEADHGRLVILGMICFAGDAEAGARAIGPLRALATPLADLVRPIPYPEMFPPEDPGYRPTAVARTMFLDRVERPEATTIMAALEASDAPMRAAQLRVLGGAMARVPVEATAFAHRRSRIMVNLAAFYDGEADRVRKERWVTDLAAALRQDDAGAYVNFLGDEGPARVRAAYPGSTWDRLAEIKRRYDPENLFRRNQNVPPAG
jgi:hypothetical protein